MPRNRSLIKRIDHATFLAECASKAMHDYNLGSVLTLDAPLKRFRERMARVKQAQVERLTRYIKAAFDKARGMTLDELLAKPAPLKVVTFEVEAA